MDIEEGLKCFDLMCLEDQGLPSINCWYSIFIIKYDDMLMRFNIYFL